VAELPHDFRDPALLERALTHASTASAADNERLEFLGDAVLDLVVAEELYLGEPPKSEGEMTELKAWIVSRKVLAEAGRELGLERVARLGHGLDARTLPGSVLANLYEACLGAVYLDAGLDAARAWVRATLAGALARARAARVERNPKQALQELCQRRTGAPPVYVLLEERGDAHARAFHVAAEIAGRRFPSAWGRTRREAESWAAREALLVLAAGEGGA
jgi:ribonuclease-3